jgi:hypothetical protein
MLCILLSGQFSICGGKHRMGEQLGVPPWITGKGAHTGIDRLGIPAQQVVRHAQPCGREAVGWVEA